MQKAQILEMAVFLEFQFLCGLLCGIYVVSARDSQLYVERFQGLINVNGNILLDKLVASASQCTLLCLQRATYCQSFNVFASQDGGQTVRCQVKDNLIRAHMLTSSSGDHSYSVTSLSGACPDGFERYEDANICLKFESQVQAAMMAGVWCMMAHTASYIADIRSQQEQDAVATAAAQKESATGCVKYWIGGSRDEMTWLWKNNFFDEEMTYTNFSAGEDIKLSGSPLGAGISQAFNWQWFGEFHVLEPMCYICKIRNFAGPM